jgi:hypothetical protein
MYKNIDYIYDAFIRFEEVTGIHVEVESSRKEYDAIVTIQDVQFLVTGKAEVRNSNQGIVISNLNDLVKKSRRPVILIAKYIATDTAALLREKEINYIDGAGNAFIKHKKIHFFISGQKALKDSKVKQARAFQESGIKLLFNLLSKPENLQLSYRKLAEQVGISIGSVSAVLKELEELNFILLTEEKRILKNKKELLERWVIAYHDVLRPRLVKKKMKFTKGINTLDWKNLLVNDEDSLWGGEPAAAIHTNYLKPAYFTIYTEKNWQDFIKEIGLIPDEEGDVEIIHLFWKVTEDQIENNLVPDLLIYADLISSGYDRNIETANMILQNDLQHIQ